MSKEIEGLKELIKIKDRQINQLTDKIDQIEDNRLHENEFDFDKLCEKYIDECAMRAMQGFLATGNRDYGSLPSNSYYIADGMLKEKLKRNGKSS